MTRIRACAAAAAVVGVLCVLSASAFAALTFRTCLTKDGKGIAEKPPPMDMQAELGRTGAMTALPELVPGPPQPWTMVLCSADLTKLDLRSKLAELQAADFDTKTKWPKAMPAGFDPAAILALGKNPGLGVRALHAKGLTGKGIGIGIIDQGLLVDHVEYADRLKLYEEMHYADATAQLHGPAVASIAVGKTVGVAPEADLYYLAETSCGENGRANKDLTVTARSIDRLLEVNGTLPKDRKIRVISISMGLLPDWTGYREVMAAVERAKAEGVFVISTSLDRTDGLNLMGLGREPNKDPERAASYSPASWYKPYLDLMPGQPMLLIPMDSRAIAGPTGARDYAFYRTGGMSWTVPYLAGLYALACQVKPEVTPEQFWAKAMETGDVIEMKDVPLPDPAGEMAKRNAQQVETWVRNMTQRGTKESQEKSFGRMCSQMTGVTRETMTEAEFRTATTQWLTATTIGDGKVHRLGRIVNPARLMETLRK